MPGVPVGGSEANVWNIAPRVGFAYRLDAGRQDQPPGRRRLLLHADPGQRFNPFTNIAPFAPGFSFNGVAFRRIRYGSVSE